MALFKCKMCGGDLQLTEGNPLATCEYCGTLQTVPSADSEKKLTLFTRANRLRLGCEFDKAAGVYEALVADFPEEAEAYWGLVLCKYGIEYVDDPATGKKIPTCHRSSFESVMEDKDFEQVLENSDITARKVYREEAKQIEEIRKGIIAVSANEEPYDIFICYKETDAKGDRTLDSVLAQDVYDVLTDKGYRVFFSRITLEDKLGQEYEPYIFAALNSAKVMLAFGTDYEYFNAVWVKNEWSRYLKIMETDKSKHLIPCYKGIDAYDMPKEFAKLQAQDMGKVGAIQDLLRGIDKLIVQKETPIVVNPIQVGQSQIDNAFSLISDGSYKTADAMLDSILQADPNNAMAYIGKLMIEQKIDTFEYNAFKKKPYKKSQYYQKVLDCGNEFVTSKLEGFDESEKVKKNRIKKVLKGAPIAVALVALLAYAGFEAFYWITVSNIRAGKLDWSQLYEIMSFYNGYRDSENYANWALYELGYDIFSDAESIVVPDYITEIPSSAFANYRKLTHITISEGVTSIGDDAFANCTALTDVTIPDSVTRIGDRTFDGCTSLAVITIPDNVTSIGEYAFSGCSSLSSITLPHGLTGISTATFNNCISLAKITIPNGVISIGTSAFDGCSGLTSVMIPASVTTICGSAFEGCTGLTSLTIGKGVTHIREGAFRGCSKLRQVTIPAGVSSIASQAFDSCESLTGFEVDKNNRHYSSDTQGILYDKKKTTLIRAPETINTCIIPKSVTCIEANAFYSCNLKNIDIPNSVTFIGDYAFAYNCLTNIKIPASVQHMGHRVLGSCYFLQEIYCEAPYAPDWYQNLYRWDEFRVTTVQWGAIG